VAEAAAVSTSPAAAADPTVAADFVRTHTRVGPPPLVPEIVLHLGDDAIEVWEQTERDAGSERPPPFWAFAWAGGQAVARYLLDHPETVAGRRVLDLAAGCGVVAVCAARAGAATVTANEIDPLAGAAITLNARANGVDVAVVLGDLLDGDHGDAETILAGDVFYQQPMTDRVLPFLRRAAAGGALVLVGDPGRAYTPREHLSPLAEYDVPVPASIEDGPVKRTTVWRIS